MTLERFSFGVGDRFGHQAKAQLRAFQMLAKQGIEVVPVWNKSNREHTFIGSKPDSVRRAAADAVRQLGWQGSYYVDADHIRLDTVADYIEPSDFFTIDVADSIGQAPSDFVVQSFVEAHAELIGDIAIENIAVPFHITRDDVEHIAAKYLLATQEAGEIYRRIAFAKGADKFVTEVSMDETDSPQTPPELLVILASLADEGVPLQTIAPKFSGRFNKGVDYVGDLAQFEREFADDIAVIAHAVKRYNLPANLKLSVHSGSDKFSLYAPIRRVLAHTGAGLHLKTAGTTWLEEIIGLAESSGEGLQIAREIYASALEKREALCAPYAAVIDIDATQLPSVNEFTSWSGSQLAASLRHDTTNPAFNPSMRQLVHVAFKLAAQMGERYYAALEANEATIAQGVTMNIYERHLKPLFLD